MNWIVSAKIAHHDPNCKFARIQHINTRPNVQAIIHNSHAARPAVSTKSHPNPPGKAGHGYTPPWFHFTKHHPGTCWLNRVEIEIGVLRCQCLDRHIRTGAACVRDRCLGASAQCRRHTRQLDDSQARKPAPRSGALTPSRSSSPCLRSKSHNPCAAVLDEEQVVLNDVVDASQRGDRHGGLFAGPVGIV